MARILAIDYGEKRIGLALSDESQSIAFEYEIWNPSEFNKNIEKLVTEKEVEKIIIGYPISLSGTTTKATEKALAFGAKLEKKINVPIEFLDERLSSKMAGSLLHEDNKKSKNVDALAAQIFLQNYLNTKNQINAKKK